MDRAAPKYLMMSFLLSRERKSGIKLSLFDTFITFLGLKLVHKCSGASMETHGRGDVQGRAQW